MAHPRVAENIRLIPIEHNGQQRWRPTARGETLLLLDHLGLRHESRTRLLDEAVGILGRCIPPTNANDSETGLVIGYVQSGKTMSFTTVAALARDNGYPLVIVVTGVSKPLFEQSTERLLRDLQIHVPRDRKWKHLPNPSIRGPALATIRDTLGEWADGTVPEGECQTVLVTVMKNHRHLHNLATVLRQLPLNGVPALIIDDEADQAGLNALVNQQDESATYRRLLEVKAALPQHSFLQYTATPQAPLLINIIDALSPSFAELLTPGPDYVGGRDFFLERPDLVRIIPDAEIPARNNVLGAPPPSLLAAMRVFFIGVAAGILMDEQRGNRSMLIHPSQETLRHAEYFRWVRDAKTEWQRILQLPNNDPDRQDLLDDFQTAYQDLAATVPEIVAFDALLTRLPHALRRTRELEVNARGGRTPPVNWHDDYAHILVGGQAMDRGFTVEGLTVTYMPRGIGVGNADTIQQRGRFFGYKRSYLGFCRVYLENDAAEAYESYVRHEEAMRGSLLEHRARGDSLDLWKRAFLLAPNLRPTRDAVLDLGYMRHNFQDDWYVPRAPHDNPTITDANRALVHRFIDMVGPFAPDEQRRTAAQTHLVAYGIPIRRVLDELLARYRVPRPTESPKFTALLIQLQQYAEENPDALADVYQMSRGADHTMQRERPLNDSGDITYLHQGRSANYPGDAEIGNPRRVRVQIHYLRLTRGEQVEAENVPAISVWLPAPLEDDAVVQPQGRR